MDVTSVLNDINKVLNNPVNFTPLHEPLFISNEWKYVKDCIDSGWVSSVGKYVDLFEEKLASYTGAKYAVAVSNGTSALHLALVVLGINEEHEVLIPSLTFIATANAVIYSGGTPHFVEAEEETLGMDFEKLDLYLSEIAHMEDGKLINNKTQKHIRVLMPMHTFGHPVNITKMKNLGKKYNLLIIEDAAESLGSFYEGKHTGTFGNIGVFSFNGNKVITTGGGGALVTNDPELARRAKHLSTTAKKQHKWEFDHDYIGFNYRMPNINAALGCAQLEIIDEYVSKKRNLAIKYNEALFGNKIVDFYQEKNNVKANYWLNVIILKENKKNLRDEILNLLNENSIMARPVWNLIHTMPMYSNCPRMKLNVSENLANTIINIPSSVKLGE